MLSQYSMTVLSIVCDSIKYIWIYQFGGGDRNNENYGQKRAQAEEGLHAQKVWDSLMSV